MIVNGMDNGNSVRSSDRDFSVFCLAPRPIQPRILCISVYFVSLKVEQFAVPCLDFCKMFTTPGDCYLP